MPFNEHQLRLLIEMIEAIGFFRKGQLQFSDLVRGLEGALDAGEFKNEEITRQWYDLWTPLETLCATKGNSVNPTDAAKYLFDMESFLGTLMSHPSVQ